MSKFAFVFPGQGSQSKNMLQDATNNSEIVKNSFHEASNALGFDLLDIINNDEERLNQTEYTQPALLTAGVASFRLWQDKGGKNPEVLAGHSLGEYTAFVCAGAIDLESGVKLTNLRGKFMQDAVAKGVGSMAAIIGLEQDVVEAVCLDSSTADLKVEVANLNSPGQIVIAGHTDAVNKACELVKTKGAKRALVLPVSVPSHCSLMRQAAEKLESEINKINWQAPKIPVLQNFDVESHSSKQDIITALIRQLYSPVRWIETIEAMKSIGVEVIVECGPGKVLTGLNKRIDKSLELFNIGDTIAGFAPVIERLV